MATKSSETPQVLQRLVKHLAQQIANFRGEKEPPEDIINAARRELAITDDVDQDTCKTLIEAARDRISDDFHATNEIEVDEGAPLSVADGGTWVNAWIWIPDPDDDEGGVEDE